MSEINNLDDVLSFLISVQEGVFGQTKRVAIPNGSMSVLSDDYMAMGDAIDWIEEHCKQPQLNENQQIVLNAFKKEYQDGELLTLALIYSSLDKGFSKKERGAYVSLSCLQEAEVLQVFAAWMLEQEESE